jgi:superfamily II DNA or RNA helicase
MIKKLLSFNSEIDEHPKDVSIKLKKHQLAMLKRCKEIENNNNIFGIMNDKPGTGKTYVILSLIYDDKSTNKTNIIVVPQNIYSQWIISIENFSKNLSYKKFINYDNIITLYNDPKVLFENDIILTTSSYYYTIATTLNSLNINISRIFFDEIDSISNIISTKINSNFIWFVSASFDIDHIGYYQNKLNESNIDDITCKCDNDFIDSNIFLENPFKSYYLCKNIYIDNILGHVVSNKELKSLNAMDYTLDNKNFEKKKAKNEKEIIEIILKNRKSSIIFDNLNIEDANKNILIYQLYYENYDINKITLKNIINELNKIDIFKNNIISFLQQYNENTYFYTNITIDIDDKSIEKLIQYTRKDEIKSLKSMFDDIIDIIYNMNDISNILNEYLINIKNVASVNNIIMNIKKLELLLNSIFEILDKINNENKKSIEINDSLSLFYENYVINKEFITNLLKIINDYQNSTISYDKLEVYKKILEVSTKKNEENEYKINLLYDRLQKNNCCPICFEVFDNIDHNKIYITSLCCNHKICGLCIDEWHNMGKSSCIFCNNNNVLKDDLLFYEKNINKDNIDNKDNIPEIDKNLIEKEDINFLKIELTKNIFLKNYIEDLRNEDKKIIIFSDYINIFEYIQEICDINKIKYVDLDKGNIKDIDNAVNEYKFGNAKILLSNSKLFGCGMNFENSTDIIFVHKMEKDMEEQVIGRAQRMGRKTRLNIIYLEYENESIYINSDKKYLYHFDDENINDNELEDYYNDKKYYNIIENIKTVDFDNSIEVLEVPSEIIDVNLESLISNLH